MSIIQVCIDKCSRDIVALLIIFVDFITSLRKYCLLHKLVLESIKINRLMIKITDSFE